MAIFNSRNIVNSGLKAAFANNGVFTPANEALNGQHIRLALLGDSITNSNTAGATDPVQDSIGYGMLRVFKVPLAGLLSGSNDPGSWWQWSASSAAVLADTDDARGYTTPTDNDPITIGHGLDNYGPRITREYKWNANTATDQAINTFKMLNNQGDFYDANWWQTGDPIFTGWMMNIFASTIVAVNIVAHGTTLLDIDILNLDALPDGWQIILGPNDRVATADMRIALRTAGLGNETGKFGIFGGGKMWIPAKNGWELYVSGVGGAKFDDWTNTAKMITDAQFNNFYGSGGVDTNVFGIALGANDSTITALMVENMIERCHATNPDCVICFFMAYGTEGSISQIQAEAQVAVVEPIAKAGTPNVKPQRIAYLNTPLLLGDTLDGLAAGNLADTIHPTRLGCTVLANAWWDEIVAAKEPSSASGRFKRMNRLGRRVA